MELSEEILRILSEGEMFLIGIGSELELTEENTEETEAVYCALASFVKGKNYFVLTGNTDKKLLDGKIYPKLVCAPNVEGQEENWKGYLNWLTCTLGHRLVVLELGEDFSRPQLMRWPFEKTVMLNQRAHLIRVGRQFPQVPKELGERAVSVRADAGIFAAALAAVGKEGHH